MKLYAEGIDDGPRTTIARHARLEPDATPVLIETVPNVSEGQRPDVLAEIEAAAQSVRGAWLLHATADPSHNRSVYSIAGPADALLEVVLAIARVAVARLDLRTHRGVHPRIGAVDVVPFIPLAGTSMAACIELAQRTAQAIAAQFDVPVFLYEEAGRPGRRALEDIRRGQFEGLAAKMLDPAWRPDYGPLAPHRTAGATVVGARKPLIAFNVDLATADIDTARSIARAIRERDGGLPNVKAIGLFLPHRGIAQVSMNLTDYEHTSPQRAFDAVVREAASRGVGVRNSELIGLIPEAALADTAPERLMLRDFEPDRILERRIALVTGTGNPD